MSLDTSLLERCVRAYERAARIITGTVRPKPGEDRRSADELLRAAGVTFEADRALYLAYERAIRARAVVPTGRAIQGPGNRSPQCPTCGEVFHDLRARRIHEYAKHRQERGAKAATLARRERIAAAYENGEPVVEIREREGCSMQTVYSDLAAMRVERRRSA